MADGKDYELVVFDVGSEIGRLVVGNVGGVMGKGLKWAVVGRRKFQLESELKLGKSESSSCQQPSTIEVCLGKLDEVIAVVRKTRVVINLLEPSFGGGLVLEACAKNGVHCVIPSYRTPWLENVMRKNHELAKGSGSMIIVGLGSDTAPQDLLAFLSVTELRKKLKVCTREVVYAHSASGNTRRINSEKRPNIVDPWALSPARGHFLPNGTNVLGIRKELSLGHISSSKNNHAQTIVHRSWGLLDGGKGNVYGKHFYFNEFIETKSPTASLKRKLFGTCCVPREHIISNERVAGGLSMKAVAIADQEGPYPDRALSELQYSNTSEDLTAVLLVQGITTILYDKKLKKRVGGGVLTPAMLGMSFIERLRGAGVEIESMLV